MIDYEFLLNIAYKNNIIVLETNLFGQSKGIIKGKKILIEKNLSPKEKTTILAHELGHYFYSSNINCFNSKKEEIKANKYFLTLFSAYSINKLINEKALRNIYEVSEELGITEDCRKIYFNVLYK